nr:reverse transcriptase domain-containing protein [Tanacetum cinerariifolium]
MKPDGVPTNLHMKGKLIKILRHTDYQDFPHKPALSIGNVGQLAMDLLIASNKAGRIGCLDDPNVLPCVGNDAYSFATQGDLVLPLEAYESSANALSLIQQRSPVVKKVQLNELNELRDLADENSLIYKEKTKKTHDSNIKNCVFNVGDRVLLFNSRLKIFLRKLKTRWTRPFTVAHVFPYGTIELSQANGPNFKANGHRLKHYFGGDIPQLVVLDLQTFAMDQ